MKRNLNEVSRKNLVGKTKVQSPARYNKRLRYSVMDTPKIDGDKFIKDDMLAITVSVGAYSVTVAYGGVMQKIIDACKADSRHILTRRIIIRCMNDGIDETDVFVRCSCCDFRYRYLYQASRHNYIWGPPENRPADIRNPFDNIGATCKHLVCVLANKKWLVKASTVVNDFIHDNFEKLKQQYNINEEEFILDAQRYAAGVTRALSRERVQSIPAQLLWVINKLYDPTELESVLNDSLSKRGWYINVVEDLHNPTYVVISRDSAAALDPEDNDKAYIFDVVPVGSKVRLTHRKTSK